MICISKKQTTLQKQLGHSKNFQSASSRIALPYNFDNLTIYVFARVPECHNQHHTVKKYVHHCQNIYKTNPTFNNKIQTNHPFKNKLTPKDDAINYNNDSNEIANQN
jgi:hypothetical protein